MSAGSVEGEEEMLEVTQCICIQPCSVGENRVKWLGVSQYSAGQRMDKVEPNEGYAG